MCRCKEEDVSKQKLECLAIIVLMHSLCYRRLLLENIYEGIQDARIVQVELFRSRSRLFDVDYELWLTFLDVFLLLS